VTGEPLIPSDDTVLVEGYEVHAAVLYGERNPDGQGALVLRLRGVCNGDGSPVELAVTIPPEEGLMLARDLRQAFQRVPVDKRHRS
jgi:hypothetical protein